MNNKFSIGEAIKAGWEKAKSNVGSFFLILVGSWIISAIISAFATGVKDTPALVMLITLLSWLVGIFLQMGIFRVALKVLDGGKAAMADFALNPEQFGKFLLGAIFYSIITGVGFVLLIIPGIIWGIRLQFIPYLIIEKNLNPMDALKRSWDITRNQTWNLFLFGLVGFLVGLLGFIALIIGLFWAIPTIIIAVAFVYRKLDRAVDVTTTPAHPAAV